MIIAFSHCNRAESVWNDRSNALNLEEVFQGLN